VAGKEISWGALDEWKCFAYYIGANKQSNPFMPYGALDSLPEGRKIMNGTKETVTPDEYPEINDAVNKYYPNDTNGYNPPKCGGCLRACLNSIEKRGVLTSEFKNSFRNKRPWKLEKKT
jgi:hypothetical protein